MIPEAAVEAAARALYERERGPFVEWASAEKRTRGQYMGEARAALEAAAPHIAAAGFERGYVSAIEEATK